MYDETTDVEKGMSATVTIIVNGIKYDDIVPKHYLYNPETEDLIYGDELEDGMMVLVEVGRRSTEHPDALRDVHITNRWCRVSKVRAVDDGLHFIGEYSDNRKATRFSESTQGWYVKKDSMPEPDPNTTQEVSGMLYPLTRLARGNFGSEKMYQLHEVDPG